MVAKPPFIRIPSVDGMKFDSQMKIDDKSKQDAIELNVKLAMAEKAELERRSTDMDRITCKPMHELYPKYYRDVSKLESIDIYRVLELFGVTDPAIQHAIKKQVIPGARTGGKTLKDDITEARDTLNRRIEMWAENEL